MITTCTDRKRKPIADGRHVSGLPQAPISDLAPDWVRRLEADGDVFPARDIYEGRSLQDAALAADLLDARLFVVSAGFGLVSADARVPRADPKDEVVRSRTPSYALSSRIG